MAGGAQMKILHLPKIVGGHPVALAAGERALGHDSRSLGFAGSPYGYRPDVALRHTGSDPLRRVGELAATFMKVRSAFDVYHFNFGASLIHFPTAGIHLAELPFYRRDALRVMTFQGSDARLDYPTALDLSISEEVRRGRVAGGPERYPGRQALGWRRAAIERAARHCAHIFAVNPDLLQHLPREKSSFLPYAIPDPLAGLDLGPEPVRDHSRPLHFVHASTDPLLKGTGLIENALTRAKDELGISYEIVVRAPRPDALKKARAADYLVDQLVLGWYGGAAVEAMLMGVPVICNLDERSRALAPAELVEELPIVQADAGSLFDTIRFLVGNREVRNVKREAGLRFAARWHDPVRVAERTLATYAERKASRSD
jgi:hypothetical protein